MRDYGAVSTDASYLVSDPLKLDAKITAFSELGKAQNLSDVVEAVGGMELIWVDPASCCYALYSKLNADKVVLKQSPLALAKALKVL